MAEGIWVKDKAGQDIFLPYSEIEPELLPQLVKPIGGFCYQADDFKHIPMVRAPFYIKDWLPKQGKALVYGGAKIGKSQLAIQMGRCIGAGLPFLGMPTTQGRVLYLQFELGTEVLQSRMKQSGKEYANVFVGTTFNMKLDTPQGQEVLLNALREIEPNVLILDPLYKIISGDENEATDVKRITDFVDSIIDAYRHTALSVLIIHHAGKDSSRGGRGSSLLEGYPDSVIEIKKMSSVGMPLRVAVLPKLLRHSELPPTPIEAEMKDYEFTAKPPIPTVQKRITDMLPAPFGKIVEAGFASRATISKYLAQMVEEGQISQDSDGTYCLT